MLTYKNEQFFLSGPFNLNFLDDGKQNICYSLFCSSAVSKCNYRKWNIQCCTRRKYHPVSLMMDKQCKGRYGYTTERENKLTPTKNYNARLFHQYSPFGDVGWQSLVAVALCTLRQSKNLNLLNLHAPNFVCAFQYLTISTRYRKLRQIFPDK